MMVLRTPNMNNFTSVPTHRRKSSSDGDKIIIEGPLRALEAGLREYDASREGYLFGPLPGAPTLVRHKYLQFLISASPHFAQAARYARYLQSQRVRHVVRVCEPTYSTCVLSGASLTVHDWCFPDGEAPPPEVVSRWLTFLDNVFDLSGGGARARDEVVAVHCMAGLGRAPVLVAIALIEAGAHPFEAVGTIRAQRCGAINARQMAFLESYVPRRDAYNNRRPTTQVSPKHRRQGFGLTWMRRHSHRQSHMSVGEHR